MSGGDTNTARSINRSAIGPPDPFNTLLQQAGLAAGGQFGLTGIGGSRFGQGLGFNRDVFGNNSTTGGIGLNSSGSNILRGDGFFGQGGGEILGRIPGRPGQLGQQAAPQGGIIGNASGVLNDTILGKFLTPDSNPFLQGTFNRAADLTRNRLSSEFAGAGRNLGASLPARSNELQTLASNIFGGNFQAERDRQMQGIFGAQSFDPLNILISRLSQLTPLAGRNQVNETTQDAEFKASPIDRALGGLDFIFG